MHFCESCETEIAQAGPYGLCPECQLADDKAFLDSDIGHELVNALLTGEGIEDAVTALYALGSHE